MHWVDILIFALAAAIAMLTTRALKRQNPTPPLPVRFVAGTAAGIAVLAVSALWLAQPDDPWNAARLTPAVALHRGYRLYYPLEGGPVLSTVVGPVAFLFYWPIAWLRGSATALILVATALNIIVFFLLGRALLRRLSPGPVQCWLAGLIGVQLALFYPPLRYSLFAIHADAPGLALSMIGLLVLFARPGALTWRRCMAAALCFALAAWAKQSLAPLFAAVALALALRDGRAALGRFLGASALIGVIVSAVFIAGLGLQTLRLNMLSVPAHHAWTQMSLTTGETFRHLTADGTLARCKVILAAILQIVRSSWVLFALGIALLWRHARHRQPDEPRWPRAAWAVCFLTTIVLLPSAALGRVKVGGEINHESLSLFFLVLAVVCWMAETPLAERQWRIALGTAALGVLTLVNAPRIFEYRGWRAAWDNQNETAAAVERAQPGRIYFPWNPLAALLESERLYHFDYGVFDRNIGGARVSATHLTEALPSPRPLIASYRAHHDYVLHEYFPDYHQQPDDPRLPGWKIYGPTETH